MAHATGSVADAASQARPDDDPKTRYLRQSGRGHTGENEKKKMKK
jgi:hypothetical protein